MGDPARSGIQASEPRRRLRANASLTSQRSGQRVQRACPLLRAWAGARPRSEEFSIGRLVFRKPPAQWKTFRLWASRRPRPAAKGKPSALLVRCPGWSGSHSLAIAYEVRSPESPTSPIRPRPPAQRVEPSPASPWLRAVAPGDASRTGQQQRHSPRSGNPRSVLALARPRRTPQDRRAHLLRWGRCGVVVVFIVLFQSSLPFTARRTAWGPDVVPPEGNLHWPPTPATLCW